MNKENLKEECSFFFIYHETVFWQHRMEVFHRSNPTNKVWLYDVTLANSDWRECRIINILYTMQTKTSLKIIS